MQALRLSRNETLVSRHVPLTHLNSPSCFEIKDGQIGSTLVIEGIPFDTATHEELNHARHVLHQAISVLGEMFWLFALLSVFVITTTINQ